MGEGKEVKDVEKGGRDLSTVFVTGVAIASVVVKKKGRQRTAQAFRSILVGALLSPGSFVKLASLSPPRPQQKTIINMFA